MICPKCGSEVINKQGKKLKLVCPNCNVRMFEYQQKLDKVLSKMKKYSKIEHHRFYYVGDSKISIEYNNEKFYLEDRDERQVQISLDTVEHLIKDMEAQNE